LKIRIMKKYCNNIQILHLIKFLSSLYFYHQVITLYFQARGLNFVQINSLWGIIMGVQALAEVPTGLIADKMGRKFSIVTALGLQFAGELLFIFADSYFFFVIICVIAGTGFAFLSGCFEAMLIDSLKAEKREKDIQKVTGLNGSFGLAATLIGSLIGGLITAKLELSTFVQAIILTAFFVLLSCLAALLLKEPDLDYTHDENPFQLLKDGLHLIKTNHSLQKIIILFLLATPFINYLLNFYPPYFVDANVNGYLFGITLAAGSLLGIAASKYAYLLEKMMGVRNGMLGAVIIPGLFYLLLAFIRHPVFSVALVILAFGSMFLQKPLFSDYLNRHIQSRNRATVLSLINFLSGFYVALIGLFIGFLADRSLPSAFIFMGSLITAAALILRISEKQVQPVSEP